MTNSLIEPAPEQPVRREFYKTHRSGIPPIAPRCAVRLSARTAAGAPSLNDCLHPGPALQSKQWDVLVRGRFHPVALVGDLRKAKSNRGGRVCRTSFHLLRDLNTTGIQAPRFSRVVFGLEPSSPFLIGSVLEQHGESWNEQLPGNVTEIPRSLYVGDLITGAPCRWN